MTKGQQQMFVLTALEGKRIEYKKLLQATEDAIALVKALDPPIEPRDRMLPPFETATPIADSMRKGKAHHNGLHWTQKPENRAKLRRLLRAANKARKARAAGRKV